MVGTGVPRGEFARVGDNDSQMLRTDVEFVRSICMYDHLAGAEFGGKMAFGGCGPVGSVGRGLDDERGWGENPVVSFLESTEGDAMDFCWFREIVLCVDIHPGIALPVAIGIGVVAAQNTIRQGVVAATAIGGAVSGVRGVETS